MHTNIAASDAGKARIDKPLFAIGLTLVGSLCFAVQDSGIKWLTVELAVVQIIFIRSLFSLGFLTVSTVVTGERISLRVQRPWLMLGRTIVNVLAWLAFFSGLKYLSLATAVALFFSFPLFLTMLSVPLLGESVGARRWTAVVVGFVGVVFITKPGGEFAWPALLMLAAALGWSLVAVATRILGRSENTSTMLFHTLIGFIASMAIPQFWLWQAVDVTTVSLITSVALFGVTAQFCLIKAYSIAPPSLIAPFEYTGLLWAALLGFIIWRDIPDLPAIVGSLLIVTSGLYIIYREAKIGRQSGPEPNGTD